LQGSWPSVVVLHFCSRLSHSKRFQAPEPPFNSVSTWGTTSECRGFTLGASMLSRFPLNLNNKEISVKLPVKFVSRKKITGGFY
jgi:hypothetical protein